MKALQFVKKIDEVDTTGVQPLENVLDYYGGNDQNTRQGDGEFSEDEFERLTRDLDQTGSAIERDETQEYIDLKQVNRHMRGNLAVVPKAFLKDE